MNYTSRSTQAIIDLGALVKNYQYIDRLAEQSTTIAVLKADAYGHIASKVAQALSSETDYFAVAFMDEAIALRQHGIETRILILEGPFKESDFDIALENNFTLMIHSHYQLQWLKSNVPDFSGELWLKVNTGMNRLGFSATQVDEVISQLSVLQHKNIVLCSHFSTADQHDCTQPQQQLAQLKSVADKYHCKYSIANSAGILNCPESHSDYNRLGLALYGLSPSVESPLKKFLTPVMSLQANIIAIQMVKVGEYVGYGKVWQAKRETRLAIIAIGYADGYPRNAKPGTPVFIKGVLAPLVGRVSMDMITVDITEVSNATIGDTVELWGKNLSVDIIAQHSDSISYELVTRVSHRVPRVTRAI